MLGTSCLEGSVAIVSGLVTAAGERRQCSSRAARSYEWPSSAITGSCARAHNGGQGGENRTLSGWRDSGCARREKGEGGHGPTIWRAWEVAVRWRRSAVIVL
eukprot:4058347-Prymnesium_polylepis.2